MTINKKKTVRLGMGERTGKELAETPGLIRVREAGRILQMCEAQIYTLAKSGEIPSYKIGRRRLFKVAELTKWIDSKRQGTAGGMQ